MNAAVYHSFGGPIRIERVPIPKVPPNDGILLKVQATGICRSDWHGWKGHDDDIHRHGLPFCPGHELSGIVVESTSSSFQPGDHVAVPFILSCGSCSACVDDQTPTVCHDQNQPGFTQWGSFAEYVALSRASRNVRHLPDNVSFVAAAALGCRMTTAYRAVIQQGQLQRNQGVAIFGCGGLGLSCIIFAQIIGADPIIAVDISEHALKKAKHLGATHVILTQKELDIPNVQDQILSLTNNQGVHVAMDAAGFPDTCEYSVHCTRRSGRMVQVGLPIGCRPPIVPMGLVAARELHLVGSHGFSADDLPTLLDMIATQKLDPMKLVERCVTLEEGAQILMDMDHSSPLGMTMITDFQTSAPAKQEWSKL